MFSVLIGCCGGVGEKLWRSTGQQCYKYTLGVIRSNYPLYKLVKVVKNKGLRGNFQFILLVMGAFINQERAVS